MNRKALLLIILLLGLSGAVYATPPDQPFMEAARAELQKAKTELQAATPNKGGHRAKALNLINQAIAEVNRGIGFARHNGHHASMNLPTPDQPHMQAAIDHLNSAKENLIKANPDKGGHRANAIKLVDEAIAEVGLGMAAGD